MIQRAQDQRGFSLVEMLVALTLLGFISVIGWHGIQLVSSTTTRVEGKASAVGALGNADDVLRDLLSQAYPEIVRDGTSQGIVEFAGYADALSFDAPLLQRYGASVIVNYRIFDNHDGTLRLTWHMIGDPAASSGMNAIVAGGLASVAFAYFGADDAASPSRWQGSWNHRRTLPELIAVRLTRRDGQSAGWPDLVVASRADAGPDCTFDPTDGKCRAQ